MLILTRYKIKDESRNGKRRNKAVRELVSLMCNMRAMLSILVLFRSTHVSRLFLDYLEHCEHRSCLGNACCLPYNEIIVMKNFLRLIVYLFSLYGVLDLHLEESVKHSFVNIGILLSCMLCLYYLYS